MNKLIIPTGRSCLYSIQLKPSQSFFYFEPLIEYNSIELSFSQLLSINTPNLSMSNQNSLAK